MRHLAAELPNATENGRLAALSRALVPLEAALSVATPAEMTTKRLNSLRADLAHLSELLTSAYLR